MLPASMDAESFRAWRAERAKWLPIVQEIALEHGLACEAAEAFPTGTNLVVALNQRFVLKLFPPPLQSQFRSERAALNELQGRLSVPVPEIVAEGRREKWSYLVITRLTGILGTQAWPRLPEDQKQDVLIQIGEAIAQVQSVAPSGDLARLEPRWDQFVATQMQGCRARHERLGLPQKYLAGLDDIVRQAPMLIPMHAPAVILTGEYIPENLLLSCRSGAWRLSGLIDFGDVMTGWREYDLLGPSAFMTAGMPGRVQSLFRGFGYSRDDLNEALTRRLLTLMLLHRASDPTRHISIEDWQSKTDSLADLERLLWPSG